MSRTTEIAKVLSKYGLDFLAHSHSPFRILGLPSKLLRPRDTRTQPERVRLALEELGTTYIKLGQAISTRSDLIPPEYVAELTKLQDDAPAVPFSEIRSMIIRELGCPPEQIFAEFEREPLAAASIGQVHRARLADGTRVVVKVQRPGAEELVEQDLKVMADWVNMLGKSKQLKDFDLKDWLVEFGLTLRNELDYRREGRNADQFRFNFKDDPTLRIPLVYWEYTSKRVLTMEEVGGTKITDLEGLDRKCIDRRRLAEECSRLVLTEVFDKGFFHADPHAGNFFVEDDGRINLIDFGMVGRIDRANRESLMRITLAMAYRDAESLVDELLVIGSARRPVNRIDLKQEIQRLIELHLEAPQDEFSLAQTFQDTLRVAAEHHIKVPSDMLFLARAIAMAEGLGSTLDPQFRLLDTARVHLERIYREKRTPQSLLDRAQENYVDIGDFALDLPIKVKRLFNQIERGEITMNARLLDTSELLENFHRATNRLSMSVLTAGIIAGLCVMTLQVSERWTRIGMNALLAIVIASGAVLLISFWKARKAD